MKIKLQFVFIMALSVAFIAMTAFATQVAAPKIKLVHVRGGIYVAEDPYFFPENSVVYVGEKAVTVISATWTPETAVRLVNEIRKVTDKPVATIVDTHHHLDRTGGNSYFKKIGATIVSTKKTAQLMKEKWAKMVKGFQKDFPSYPEVPLVLPDVTFEGHYELEGGKIRLLYLGPSHTEDGIFAYFPEDQLLDGDCIVKEKLGNLDDANLEEYPKTLGKLKDLSIKTVIAGHGSPIHGPELIDTDVRLLKERTTQGRK